MKSAFQIAVEKIFTDKNFLEEAVIDGQLYKVVQSRISSDNAYTSSGLVDETDFTLDVLISDLSRKIKPESKLSYRGKQYRVSRVEEDSGNASLKLYLRDLSRP